MTLLVNPSEAEIMAHAVRQGSITLSLRGRGDDSTLARLQPIKTSDLRGKSATPPPVVRERERPAVTHVVVERKPEPPKMVTIIRRTAKSEESLPADSANANK